MPRERLEAGTWPHPARLPLGCGWSGHCTAPGHEGEVPVHKELQESCNLGYAASCSRLPQARAWDAVRFAISARKKASGGPAFDGSTGEMSAVVLLSYVCEREHRPVEHGILQFNAAESRWLREHPHRGVQKMAECFLESYLAKKKVRTADATARCGEELLSEERGL